MNASKRFVGSLSDDAAEGSVTDSSRSSIIPVSCRALPWTNVVLCVIILSVALLLVLPLMVFYLPRDDQPSVRLYKVHYDYACLLQVGVYSYSRL